MRYRDIKPFVPHIVLVLCAVGTVVALFVLKSTEEKNLRDTVRMQEVLGIKLGLQRYYVNHAAYPPAPDGPLTLGSRDTRCLSDSGFVLASHESCIKKRYAYPIPAGYIYESRQSDDSVCSAKVGCPRYAISFSFETNLFASKGVHTLTPDALR